MARWTPDTEDNSYEVNPYSTVTGAIIARDSTSVARARNRLVQDGVVSPVGDDPVCLTPNEYHEVLTNPRLGCLCD